MLSCIFLVTITGRSTADGNLYMYTYICTCTRRQNAACTHVHMYIHVCTCTFRRTEGRLYATQHMENNMSILRVEESRCARSLGVLCTCNSAGAMAIWLIHFYSIKVPQELIKKREGMQAILRYRNKHVLFRRHSIKLGVGWGKWFYK